MTGGDFRGFDEGIDGIPEGGESDEDIESVGGGFMRKYGYKVKTQNN